MESLVTDQFPLSNKYNPTWLTENPMGAHPLWLTEWMCQRIELREGMRVLDLGCGTAKSSVFLAREFGVQVWATDLWTPASENRRRIADAELGDRVFPIHADAHDLPFASEFFDAILCTDAYNYVGTSDGYLNYLVQFLRPGGLFSFASAGLMADFGVDIPDHLRRFWTADCWTIHTAAWWHRHLAKTGLVAVTAAESMKDGWRRWLEWAEATDASTWYRDMLRTDAGRYLGYVGIASTRADNVELVEHAWPSTLKSMPSKYERHPILRPT